MIVSTLQRTTLKPSHVKKPNKFLGAHPSRCDAADDDTTMITPMMVVLMIWVEKNIETFFAFFLFSSQEGKFAMFSRVDKSVFIVFAFGLYPDVFLFGAKGREDDERTTGRAGSLKNVAMNLRKFYTCSCQR